MIDFLLKNKPRSRSLIIALLVLAILLPLWWRTGLWYRERLLTICVLRSLGLVTVHADLLSAAINQRLSPPQGTQDLHGYAHRLQHGESSGRNSPPLPQVSASGATGIRNVAIISGRDRHFSSTPRRAMKPSSART